MKEFISGIAMLILICVFLTQFTVNQVIQNKIIFAESDINTFIEQVRQDGYITAEARSELEEELRRDLKLDTEDEISVTGDTEISDRKQRGELISYSVSYPVKNVYGAAKMFGISEDNNRLSRTRSGKTASEYIG